MKVTSPTDHPAALLPGQSQDVPDGQGEKSQPPFESTSSDVFIALMGMTGSGKSTFISHCTDEEVMISAPGALESCTQEVRVHRCNYFQPHANVYLVDTPGFDDTNRKDTDILKEIATWLTQTYQQKIRLRGILYLHRISDNRMGGCAQKNLVMFKRLCGPGGIKNVRFITTFWENVEEQDGERREQTLQTTEQFWGFFVNRGAEIRRHMNTSDSALWLLAEFVPGYSESPPEETDLAIQTEMVDSGKDLDQTAAGQELQNEFVREREKMQAEMKEREEDMKEALAARDKEMFDFLRQEQERQRDELRRRDNQMQELRVSMERLHEEKLRQLQAILRQQKEEQTKYQQEVDRVQKQFLTHIQELRAERATEKSQYESSIAKMTQKINAERAAEKSQYEASIANLTQQIQGLRTKEETKKRVSSNQAYYSPQKSYEVKVKPRRDPYTQCLTCGKYFSRRNDLFDHIEAEQHGRDLRTLKREPFFRY
ncbi:P-loop containing nucleoside triphosphate hydrolase protein [Aspergillus crustosus]